MGEEMGTGAGWLTWRAAAALAVAAWLALHVAARVADALWWRPRRLEAHFAAQGVRGPPYRFLLGSVKEMVGLMAEASSKPMSPATSHNALPRVLAFYHYWRKIYGALASSPFFVFFFLLRPSHLSLSPMCFVAGHVSRGGRPPSPIASSHLFGRFRLRLRDLFPLLSLSLVSCRIASLCVSFATRASAFVSSCQHSAASLPPSLSLSISIHLRIWVGCSLLFVLQ